MFKVKTNETAVWETVQCEDGCFQVLLRFPTAQELTMDMGLFVASVTLTESRAVALSEQLQRRFGLVLDWKELLDENDQPLLFSQEMLWGVLSRSPAAFAALRVLVGERFDGRREDRTEEPAKGN